MDSAVSAAGSFLRPRLAALALRLAEAETLAPGGYVTSSTVSTGAAAIGSGAGVAGGSIATTTAVGTGVTTSGIASLAPATVGVATAVTAIAVSVPVALNPDPLGLNHQATSQPQAQEPLLENSRTRASRGYTQSDIHALVQQFLAQLSEDERARIMRNETVAIALVQEDGYQHLWYAVAGNRTSPAIRAAADALGLERITATPRTEGRGDVGAPMDAEQLLLGAVDANDVQLMGRPEATRPYCPDCRCAVNCH